MQLFKDAGIKPERDLRISEVLLLKGYRLKKITATVGLYNSSVSHIANAVD